MDFKVTAIIKELVKDPIKFVAATAAPTTGASSTAKKKERAKVE